MGFKDFDESKDKCIKSFGTKKLSEDSTLEIGIYSYNNGPKRFRGVRSQKAKNGNIYYKSVVNLDLNELELVKQFIDEALEVLGS